jgi:hypothetical protein
VGAVLRIDIDGRNDYFAMMDEPDAATSADSVP